MDPETVNVVLAALAAAGAGASAGLEDAAKAAVTDAYQALVGRLKEIWPRRGRSDDGSTTATDLDAEELIAHYREDPEEWDSTIRDVLRRIDNSDPTVASLAADICALTNGKSAGDSTVFVNNVGLQDARRAYKPHQANYFGPTAPTAPADEREV